MGDRRESEHSFRIRGLMSSVPGALVVFRNCRASATSSGLMLMWLGHWFAGGRMKSLTVNMYTELKYELNN